MPAPIAPRTPIGDHLRAIRVAKGHTQSEAARAIGVGLRTWHRWERGDGAPDLRAIRDYQAGDLPPQNGA